MIICSDGLVAGKRVLVVSQGHSYNTGVPLMQVADIVAENFSFENAPTGDTRLRVLGISKGKEKNHINTVQYEDIKHVVESQKMNVVSSSGKVRIVTLVGLRRIFATHPKKEAIVQALLRLAQDALIAFEEKVHEWKEQQVAKPVASPVLAVQEELPLVSIAPPPPVPEVQLPTEISPAVEQRLERIEGLLQNLFDIVSVRHPLMVRHRWLTAANIAESFDVEQGRSVILEIQSIADMMITKRQAEGYDVQFGAYPDNMPRYSMRLARLIVSTLEGRGYKVKIGFLRA